MNYRSLEQGGALRSRSWAQSPMFKLRIDTIRTLMAGCPRGRFLEVGAGTGEVCAQLLRMGHVGIVYDLGQETRDALSDRFWGNKTVEVVDSIEQITDESVDYLFAFEVLEHIEDDLGALAKWTSKLRAGGMLLASVPAHQAKYGLSDRRVGHVRRYEREQLLKLAEQAGFSDVSILSYGFPLGTMGRIVGSLLERRLDAKQELSPEQRSIKSGTEQSRYVVALDRLLNPVTLWPFFLIQRLVSSTDLGEGYFLRAFRSQTSHG